MNQECQLLFFRLRKTFGIENQSPSWTFRGIQVAIYQGCCYLSSLCTSLSNILWTVRTESTILVRKICIYFALTVARNRKFPYANQSHMTDEIQFLRRGISFSLRKPTRWKIYLRQSENSLTLLSVKIAADQLINRPSLSAESRLSNR